MKVVLSKQAATDLERIALAISADNPARGVSFVAELRAKCASLGECRKPSPSSDNPMG
jgi:plasmid stabilization system protein ParE